MNYLSDFKNKDGSIRYDELAGKHICGACEGIFESEAEYCAHVCEKTGHAADTLDHQDALTDGQASRVSAAALERGEKSK